MKLTLDLMKELAEIVMRDPAILEERKENKKRHLMYHGSTKEVIKDAICTEFKKQETITELMSRLVSLNIMQKIINKLAGVYKEDPSRNVKSKDETEQEKLDKLTECMEFNQRMKEANRFFKINKKALIEPYLDDLGVPSLRVLPAHTYVLFSYKTKKKNLPNVVVKIDEVAERLIFWTDESHYVTNYKGEPMTDLMQEMGNTEGENPYGILQFQFINESSSSVSPIQDDDLLGMSVTIPVILTDLLFGLKYQCWAIIWTVGKVGDIPFNPNSVIQMEWGEDGQEPSVNQIKPEIDSDKLLNTVMALVALLLTTKNLKAGTISDKVTAENAASGIAMIIDNSESTEDKKDQQAFFYRAEKGIFQKLKVMMRYWKETKQLHTDYDFDLPEDFEVVTQFQDPRPLMTEQEMVETSEKKLKAGFTTLKRELKKLYPGMDDEEVEELYREILEEKKTMAELFQGQEPGEDKPVEGEEDNGMESEAED